MIKPCAYITLFFTSISTLYGMEQNSWEKMVLCCYLEQDITHYSLLKSVQKDPVYNERTIEIRTSFKAPGCGLEAVIPSLSPSKKILATAFLNASNIGSPWEIHSTFLTKVLSKNTTCSCTTPQMRGEDTQCTDNGKNEYTFISQCTKDDIEVVLESY